MKKTGIIIINYKEYANKFLAECRDTLRIQTYPKNLFNVYIVDNASSEKSRNYIKKQYPESIIIPRPDGNYSVANNAGIKRAIENGCEYLVITNMDTSFDENWLSELVLAIESNENIGMAQSKILLYPKTHEEKYNPTINSIGNIMHFLGFGFTKGYKEKNMEIAGYPEIKGYASGCSYITTKDVVNKIGGYNEEYYMYHDDIEMGWKAKLAGYKVILAPKSIMYHKYEFSRSIGMLYYMERNRYLAMFHFYKIWTLLIILPVIIGMEIAMFLYSIINGWFKIKIKVFSYFLNPKTWLKIIKTRKEIKEIRKVNDKDIIKDFSGKVLFQEIDNPILKYIANPLMNIYWSIVKKIVWW